MRLLLDTNVLIAAFVAHGTCNELLECCAINHHVFLSPFIVSEFRGKLVQKFRFTAREVDAAVRLLESRFEMIVPAPLRTPMCRDPDDDNIIAAALAASCDRIVTGDKDLLDLKEIEGIRIISPSQFWESENG